MKPISLFDGQLTISAETVVTIIACVIIMVALIWFVNHVRKATPCRLCPRIAALPADGRQRQRHHFADLRHRLCAGGGGWCVALLVLPDLAAHHRRFMPGIKAFVAAVFGGIGSIRARSWAASCWASSRT